MSKEVRNFNRRYAKEYHWFRTLFYMSFLYLVVYPIYNLYYDYKVIGRENLPPKMAKRGKYIYAANHVSQLDPPMVVMGAHCPIAFMAKKELFLVPGLGYIIKKLGAFPIERGSHDLKAVDYAKHLVLY